MGELFEELEAFREHGVTSLLSDKAAVQLMLSAQ